MDTTTRVKRSQSTESRIASSHRGSHVELTVVVNVVHSIDPFASRFLVNSSSTDCQIPSSRRHIRVKTVSRITPNDCQQARFMREDDPIANGENSTEGEIANSSNDRTTDENEASI